MSGSDFGGSGLSIDELEKLPYWQRCELLAGAIQRARDIRDEQKFLHDEAQSYLIELMGQQKATVADGPEWHINIEYDRRYKNVVEGGLDQLQAYVDPETYEQTVQEVTEFKVNGRMLNVLKKRGGPVADVIERAHVLDRETATVALSRKSREG